MTDTGPTGVLEESTTASKKTGKRKYWRLLRLAAIDLSPLRSHRDFRLFFIGQVITNLGNMVSTVAVMYQVFALTRSPLAVGVFGIVEFAPVLLLAFWGGALADALDRRWIAQFTELSLAALSGLLLINALQPAPRLWVLYLVSVVAAALSALQRPALSALLPCIVERDEIVAAASLTKGLQSIGQILGPALAGLLIAYAGLPVVYGIDVASFLVSLLTLRLMHAVPPPIAVRLGIRSIFVGLRFLRGQPVLLSTYLVDIVGTFFGFPTALFPAFAVLYTRNNSGIPAASALGLLYAAPAAGALLVAVSSGWTRHVHRHGLGVILAVMVWGMASVGLGLAPSLPLAIVCLALIGGANLVSGVYRSAISSAVIPDALRGRLAGVELIAYTSGPVLGNVEAGAVATIFTPQISALSGGVLCVLAVSLLLLALPGLRRYDHRDNRNATQG